MPTGAESPEDRFKRLATQRTNAVLEKLRILGNLANRQVYKYTEDEIDRIFSTIERQVKEIRASFHFPNEEKFRL